jgi:hypothetical protein
MFIGSIRAVQLRSNCSRLPMDPFDLTSRGLLREYQRRCKGVSTDRIVHCINVITDYVDRRAASPRSHLRPPAHVVVAAHHVRTSVALEQLHICREWLGRCGYAPSRVLACHWDLGGEVEYFIWRNRDAMQEAMRHCRVNDRQCRPPLRGGSLSV